MKKEEFTALGISEELAAKAEAASLKELEGYVPKEQLDTANTEKKHLQDDIKIRDKQLEELKKSGGDNAELKKQIEDLQKVNKEDAEKHASEMKELRLTSAIKLAVAGKVHDEDMAAALFDRTKLVLTEDGKVAGLEEQLKTIRESKGYFPRSGAVVIFKICPRFCPENKKMPYLSHLLDYKTRVRVLLSALCMISRKFKNIIKIKAVRCW